MDSKKYGLLLNESDIKLQRKYFNEMIKLIGIQVIYRAARENKTWTTYSEIDSNYFEPIVTGCIFEEHPNQYTMKKLGWVSEVQENSSLIVVPYDLPHIQVGALFILPSGIDNAKGRVFRVVRMSNIMLYPASITCEIVPEYEDIYSNVIYKNDSLTLLTEEEEPNMINPNLDKSEMFD